MEVLQHTASKLHSTGACNMSYVLVLSLLQAPMMYIFLQAFNSFVWANNLMQGFKIERHILITNELMHHPKY